MPLKHYGILKGRPIGAVPEIDPDTPHYQVHIVANDVDYRIAVNVKSNSRTNSELQYFVNTDFHHPILLSLLPLPIGFTPVQQLQDGMALDYIRGNLFDLTQMRILPYHVPGPQNDLNELLDEHVQRAIQDSNAMIYAFGQRWGPEPRTRDKVFRFRPGNGMHDIHMNQGNDASHAKDNGVWQDGGLLIHFPSSHRWVGIFLKFQSQTTHTQEGTGHRIDLLTEPIAWAVKHPDRACPPDKIIRIIAAQVNPFGGKPEIETVTLLNPSPDDINLKGWSLVDRMKHPHPLSGTIASGDTLKITLSPQVQLGNKGGIITLLNAQGLKVDGVSYTKDQAADEGWSVVF
jgi:uncharacterized protein YukJ